MRRERGRDLGAVGVLERQDQPPPLRVVAQVRRGRDGTPAGRRGSPGTAGPLRPSPACGERHAAPRAARLGDEAGLAEALGAEQARCAHRRVAGHAVRRQQQVEQRAPRRRAPSAGSGAAPIG